MKTKTKPKPTKEKDIYCPMCGTWCGSGMGSGRIYMLHHTIGCDSAKRY